jgi:Protein of unknown function (DUF1604)
MQEQSATSAQRRRPSLLVEACAMTSRLKKKLDTMGVDVQSTSQRLTENFCLVSGQHAYIRQKGTSDSTKCTDWHASATTREIQRHRGICTPLETRSPYRNYCGCYPSDGLQVRDEQGRRRLHGAFTGGFSAGYYNTVGSKEGAFTSPDLRSQWLISHRSRLGSLYIHLVTLGTCVQETG